MPQLAANIWADGPASTPYEPFKPYIRDWGAWVEGIIAAFVSTGGRIYQTKALLTADLAPVANSLVWVMEDPVASNNGVFRKVGGTGTGSWVRAGDLPYSFIIASDAGAGTPNAIRATTSIPVSPSALIWMNIADTNNASPVTVQFNGGTVYTVKTNSGNDPSSAGGLAAGTIVLGIVSGSTFRLVSDQASSAIIAQCEALLAQVQAVAAGISVGAFATAAQGVKADNAVPSTRALTGSNGVTAEIGNLSTDRIVSLIASLGTGHATATDANLLLSSGRWFGAASVANAPDATRSYWYEVVGNGTTHAKVIATDSANPYRSLIREISGGPWGPWTLQNANSVFSHGGIGDGTTPAQAAFTACIAAQTARINTIPAYDNMPQAPDCEIRIPGGLWHLTAPVDNGGKAVIYIADTAVRFTSGSALYLNGPVIRPDRTSLATPYGILGHVCPDSVAVGRGAFDNPPLITGVTDPTKIGTQIDTIDLVGRYTDVSSPELSHSSAATYTLSGCVLATAVPFGVLRAGTFILTAHSPTAYIGQILSWSADRKTITVNGWYLRGGPETPATPSSSGSPVARINPFEEIYGQNTNVFLLSEGYATQGTGIEIGLYNTKAAPASAEDPIGKTWAYDAVNLATMKCSIAFIARGAFREGYRATHVDIGFRSASYAGYGYSAPAVGFEHQGPGVGFRLKDATGTTKAQIYGDGIIDGQKLNLFALVNAANDAAAAAAGVVISGVYRNGSQLMIRVT